MYTIQKIEQEIMQSLKAALGKKYTPEIGELTAPPEPKWGEISFPCFGLAKGFNRPPAEIAAEIAPKIEPKGFIAKVEARGPYINFYLEPKVLAKRLFSEINLLGEKYGSSAKIKRRVMVEYSGLNTHKPVHIGHIRNLVFGASIVRLMRARGIDVIAADFVNDLGLNVAQWLWCYQKYHNEEKPPVEALGQWLSDIYTESVSKYEADPAAKAEVMAVLAKLQFGDRKLMKLWKKTRGWCLREFDAVHKDLDAKFDIFYAESQFVDARMKIVEQLKKKGIATVSEGATIVNLEDAMLGVQVILRSDGTALYATTDLALAVQKFKDEKIDASYVITDARQKHHFAQLFETLRRFGYAQQMKHLAYEFVTLPDGTMSSRKGNVILYENFRDELFSVAESETKNRHSDWSEKEIRKTARKVALAALKYDMLRQDSEKPIVFDIKAALSFEGMSGPYLQYTGARISSLLKKSGKKNKSLKISSSSVTENIKEKQLLFTISRFPQVVLAASNDLRPSLAAEYLFNLSRQFSEFYETVPILKASNNERIFRLNLVKSIRIVLENGARLLGIEIPEAM